MEKESTAKDVLKTQEIEMEQGHRRGRFLICIKGSRRQKGVTSESGYRVVLVREVSHRSRLGPT